MFGKKKDHITDKTRHELIARYANLLVHCYGKRDVTGIQVTVTALTHLCYAMGIAEEHEAITREFVEAVEREQAFPNAELPYVNWLLNHFFQQEQEQPAEFMLPWYQKLDDEWLVRKKLKASFPEKNSTEITAMLLHEVQRRDQEEQVGAGVIGPVG